MELKIFMSSLPEDLRSAECELFSLSPFSDERTEKDCFSFTPGSPGHYVLRRGGVFVLFIFISAQDGKPELPANRSLPGQTVSLPAPPADEIATSVLQEAIDELSDSGGGVLRLAAGTWLVGTFFMKSGVYLELGPDVLLQGVADPVHWPEFFQTRLQYTAKGALVYFRDVENCGIFGGGRLNGNGSRLRHRARFQQQDLHPYGYNLVRAENSRRILLQDLCLEDSLFWNTHLIECSDVVLREIKILNEMPPKGWLSKNAEDGSLVAGPRMNSADGINPDACSDVLIENVFAWCGDNCIPIKNTGRRRKTADGWGSAYTNGEGNHYRYKRQLAAEDVDRESEVRRITVRRCTCVALENLAALKIGTETFGRVFEDISFEDALVFNASHAFSAVLYDSADVNRVEVKRVRCVDTGGSGEVRHRPRFEGQAYHGRPGNIFFEHKRLA
jgi:hypothetical protein